MFYSPSRRQEFHSDSVSGEEPTNSDPPAGMASAGDYKSGGDGGGRGNLVLVPIPRISHLLHESLGMSLRGTRV